MVEVPPPPVTASWRTSSYCDYDGDCVQVTCYDEYVWVRDSTDPGVLILGLTRERWAAFLGGVRSDEFSGSGIPA
jgi:hypothetical protein